jgi:hypothetical protein
MPAKGKMAPDIASTKEIMQANIMRADFETSKELFALDELAEVCLRDHAMSYLQELSVQSTSFKSKPMAFGFAASSSSVSAKPLASSAASGRVGMLLVAVISLT